MVWVPYIERCAASVEPYDKRRDGMLYVGGMHGLSLVAVEWLVGRVQPLIAAARGEGSLLAGGEGHLYLVGPRWARGVAKGDAAALNRSVSNGHATLLGTISDGELDQYLQQHKVFTAPVFNGTGIATKNVLALSRGLPLVTTAIGLNGLGLAKPQEVVSVAETPEEFSHQVLRLQRDAALFGSRSAASFSHARQV